MVVLDHCAIREFADKLAGAIRWGGDVCLMDSRDNNASTGFSGRGQDDDLLTKGNRVPVCRRTGATMNERQEVCGDVAALYPAARRRAGKVDFGNDAKADDVFKAAKDVG